MAAIELFTAPLMGVFDVGDRDIMESEDCKNKIFIIDKRVRLENKSQERIRLWIWKPLDNRLALVATHFRNTCNDFAQKRLDNALRIRQNELVSVSREIMPILKDGEEAVRKGDCSREAAVWGGPPYIRSTQSTRGFFSISHLAIFPKI